ncbi:MAG: bifunctional transaldolase/phosoglucose isomerase [Candidatus Hydrothermarchaeaceae archaeon]
MNPLKELKKYGQAVWLDYIRRSLITSGNLSRMIDEDGLTGVTINPTIFEKAIAGSDDYDGDLAELLGENPHLDARKLYEKLAVSDVQMTADILMPIYESTGGADGFVSLELSPGLANDTKGSIKEAHYFWEIVNRPNLMIKVPATREGIPVIEALIAKGINVNVTLMFSLSHYEAVSGAYLSGLEKCEDPSKISSVASFFVSRVDSIVDKSLENNPNPDALKLRGKIAVSNSKMAYERFKEIFSGSRWKRLAKRGARVQRVLWASTGTKIPEYSDVLYVAELIGPDTVNTLPPATLNAFKDHGRVRASLEDGIMEARESLEKLSGLEIDLSALTEKLQVDGVESFSASYDKLILVLEEKRKVILQGQIDRQDIKLGDYQAESDKRLRDWEKENFNRRLWEKDQTIWFEKPTLEIMDRLGWLNLPEMMHEHLEVLTSFSEDVKSDGIKFVVLLGEGGSSLAAEVYQHTFGSKPGYPELFVLDSTHPDAVREIEEKIDLRHSLFIVSSKSGTTLEPLSFFKYFWEKVSQAYGDAGKRFIAITDPKTPLVKLAEKKGFKRIFLAPADMGGRYSALSVFGLVPASLIGIDVHKLLDRAWVAAEGCAFCVSEQKTPSLMLGAALGELAERGRDKVTFLSSPSLKNFPDWLEQLIAESTGKDNKGIIPVVNEPTLSPNAYCDDRFFVYFYIEDEVDKGLKKDLKMLEDLGHPIARINLSDKFDIGLEIFQWEIAVAAAGSILGIHPFNQPDVELSKELARKAMKSDAGGGMKGVETVPADSRRELSDALNNWISGAKEGDYVCIQAYLAPGKETKKSLQKIRMEILNRVHLATMVGYGPRFLHSTGQLHKGGPNNGLFLQLVDEPGDDLNVPEADYTFGQIIRAQAMGDFQALKKRGRRVLRINLNKDVAGGLSLIAELIRK